MAPGWQGASRLTSGPGVGDIRRGATVPRLGPPWNGIETCEVEATLKKSREFAGPEASPGSSAAPRR